MTQSTLKNPLVIGLIVSLLINGIFVGNALQHKNYKAHKHVIGKSDSNFSRDQEPRQDMTHRGGPMRGDYDAFNLQALPRHLKPEQRKAFKASISQSHRVKIRTAMKNMRQARETVGTQFQQEPIDFTALTQSMKTFREARHKVLELTDESLIGYFEALSPEEQKAIKASVLRPKVRHRFKDKY